MSTRKHGRERKTETKNNGSWKKEKELDLVVFKKGMTLGGKEKWSHFSPTLGLPDEYKYTVLSNGIYNSSATTLSITQTMLTNSLLFSGHAFFAGGQSSLLDDFAKHYQNYRVLSYKIQGHVYGREDDRCHLAILHSAFQPSFPSGTAFDWDAPTYPRSNYLLLGCGTSTQTDSPNNREIPKYGYSIESVAGSPTVLTDDKYAGSITAAGVFAAPATTTYCHFHSAKITGAAFTALESPLISVRFKQVVKFYNRRN